ncbi:MAG: hypothetical protein M5T61_16870 [Acidimicrobiia bacterium]|nr:hypothetical protein [Acidimicrobiia bacterium]
MVGWSMGERQSTDLVVAALVMALGRRNPTQQLLHHADHGAQYTSMGFTNRLADWGLAGSYGSVGDCYDNAAMEAFWATLKKELRHIWGPPPRTSPAPRCARSCSTTSGSLLQPSTPSSRTRRPHPG